MGRNALNITKEELEDALKEGKTQYKAGEILKISQASVCNYMKEYGITPSLYKLTPEIEYHKMPEYSYDQLKEYLLPLQDLESPYVGYNEVDIMIETDLPIKMKPSADWHLGGRWVDYKRLTEWSDSLLNDPQSYTILAGDYCDNYNTSAYKGGQIEERIPIQVQKALAETMIKTLSPKILTIINGCHDEWSYFNDGFEFGKYLADRGFCYYLGHNGYINLYINDIKYRIFVTHNTFRWSTINDGHGLRSMLREKGDFDIGICAHTHKPHVETFSMRGEKKWIMTCGTFKGQDRFTSKKALPPTIPCTPGFILDNEKKEVQMNIDYRELERYG